MKLLRFIIVSLLGLFAIIYLLFLAYVYVNQVEMIFHANKLPKDYTFEFDQDFEEITVASFDKTPLNGLLFKAQDSKGVIFYLHGNAGALDRWGQIAQNYTDLGYDIFILDYRGFGKSGGTIENEEQFYKDVSTAYQDLLSRYNEKDVVIIGYSIGTGPAAYLASKNHPKTLILQAPYYNFSELSDSRVPFVPNFIKKFSFETNSFLPKITAPIYIFHGNKDHVISYSNSIRLSKLLKPSDHFYILEDQEHIGLNDNREYQTYLKELLND